MPRPSERQQRKNTTENKTNGHSTTAADAADADARDRAGDRQRIQGDELPAARKKVSVSTSSVVVVLT